jgi:nitronate monooxygenase
MAGATTPDMVIAVSEAGGLGSLPSALYTEIDLRPAPSWRRTGPRSSASISFPLAKPMSAAELTRTLAGASV